MSIINVDDEFASYEEVEQKIQELQEAEKFKLWKRDSRKIAAAIKRMPKRVFNPDLKYNELLYCCVYGGREKKDELQSRRQRCPYQIKFRCTQDGQRLRVVSITARHNHSPVDFPDVDMEWIEEAGASPSPSQSDSEVEFLASADTKSEDSLDSSLGQQLVTVKAPDFSPDVLAGSKKSFFSGSFEQPKMPRILSVCTLPQSDIQWEEPVIINLDEEDSLSMDEPHIAPGSNDFADLNMEVEEETMVNVETLDSKIKQDLQEFRRKKLEENENLKQVFVAALSRGICDDISKFNRKQKHLSNGPCLPVDSQACTDGSAGNVPVARVNTEDISFPFAKVKAEESSFQFTIVKPEASSLLLTNDKTESDVSDTENSYGEPYTSNAGDSDTDDSDTDDSDTDDSEVDSSSETETTDLKSHTGLQPSIAVKSHTGFRPSIALKAENIQSMPTVNKKKPWADHAETHSGPIVRNGLMYQKVNNNKTSGLPMSHQNLLSHKAPHPVFMVRPVSATLKKVRQSLESSLKAKVPKRKVQKKAISKIKDSCKRCLVCNAPCLITENRKLPSLPFCKRCKRSYFYQLSRCYTINNSICRSGVACRIDYRRRKMCPRCHHKKFLAVLSAAEKLFKKPFQLKYSGKYTRQEISEQKKYDWSIIRDEILLQEALIFQPRVLLKRIDEGIRPTDLSSVSKVTGVTKQAPLNLTDPNGHITSKSLPHLESKGRIILKLLEKPIYSPSLVTLETSSENDRQKSLSSSVACKKLHEVPNVDDLCASQLQQHRTTSAISEDNIMAHNSEARQLTLLASHDGENFEFGDAHEVSSLMTPDSLPESVSKTNMPAVVGGHVKDVSKEHEAVDTVTDRLVSRYSGRKIRRKIFSSYSYSALRPPAKSQRWETRAPKKNVCEPSKVSVFICGHVCSVCNAAKTCKWLRDHGYSKTPPLFSAKCSDMQEVMKDGTSSKAVLILKKLAELNELLKGSSNMLLELKNIPLQHEFLNTAEASSSSNSGDAWPSTLQNASDAMVEESSTHEALGDAVHFSLSSVFSILPNDILLEQSPQLQQELQVNPTNTSEPAVCSFPLTCSDLLQSLQQPLESMGRQSPQPAVTTTDLAPSLNTTLSNCL